MDKYEKWYISDNCISTSLSVMLDAIMTFYLLKQGLGLANISLCFSISLIVSTLVEFPSGVLADRFGRKKIYAFGLFSRAIQCLILLITRNIFLILLSGVFEGIHNALISGALESWLLKESKDTDYNKLLGINKIFTSLTSFIFMLIITFLINDSGVCIIICFFAYLLSGIINIFYLDDNRDEDSNARTIIFSTIDFMKLKQAKFLLLVLVMFYGVISVYMLLFQGKANEYLFSDTFVLIASLFSLLGGILAGYFYSKTSAKSKNKIIFISLTGIIIAFIIFVTTSSKIMMLIGNMLYGFAQAMMFPYFYSELFKILPDKSIASNISMISAGASLFAAVVTYLLGLITKWGSLDIIAYIGIIFSFGSMLLIKYIYHQSKVF